MRVFYILSIILLISAQGKSQARVPSADPSTVRVIKFYPNPAVSQITFDFDQGYDKSYTFQIFNFPGKKVFELQAVTPKAIVNVTDFYRGIYIFQLKDKSGKVVESGKFQVSH
jgi:Secretion system C-terminal sorting domain